VNAKSCCFHNNKKIPTDLIILGERKSFAVIHGLFMGKFGSGKLEHLKLMCDEHKSKTFGPILLL